MKYKSEILVNGNVEKSYLVNHASHPNQIVRKTVMTLNTNQPLLIAVMNENGDRWLYYIQNKKARVLKNDTVHYNKDDIVMVMNNHKCIYTRNEL
jgi:hypothetical protein